MVIIAVAPVSWQDQMGHRTSDWVSETLHVNGVIFSFQQLPGLLGSFPSQVYGAACIPPSRQAFSAPVREQVVADSLRAVHALHSISQ